MYQLLSSGSVLRLSDHATVPPDDRNTDWVAYQQWLAEGNEPLPVSDSWRSQAWTQFRSLRDVYLYRLEGIAGRAFRSGDEDLANDIDVFIQGILDIPQHASTQVNVTPTLQHLEYAINLRFVQLKNACLGDPNPEVNPQYTSRKTVIDKVFK